MRFRAENTGAAVPTAGPEVAENAAEASRIVPSISTRRIAHLPDVVVMGSYSIGGQYQKRRIMPVPLVWLSGLACLYNCAVALVVFLRGINVGGYRRFRPSILAKQLSPYDVVNIGAAGTFVVRNPGPRAKFRAQLLRKLPFAAHVALCEGRDLVRLELDSPFGTSSVRSNIVRFVSILSKTGRCQGPIPCAFPPSGPWFVRVIDAQKRFVFGEYRRHLKTIGYLGQIDQLFGCPATTRNWNTIVAIVRILKSAGGLKRD
jgi:uncharacterized protein (DUF1697 family)